MQEAVARLRRNGQEVCPASAQDLNVGVNPMRPEKRKALEAAGWTFGDAADFLAMTDEERQMLDLRVGAALAVRRQREAMRLSQQELARRIHTSQPRIV